MVMQSPKITDAIGDLLQEEYGPKDPNTHIRYFYLRFGKECVNYKHQIIETLKSIVECFNR